MSRSATHLSGRISSWLQANLKHAIPVVIIALIIFLFFPQLFLVPFAFARYSMSSTSGKVEIMIKASSGCGTCMNGYDVITGPDKIPLFGDKAIPALVNVLAWDGHRALGPAYRSIAAVELWNLGDNGKNSLRQVAMGTDNRRKAIAMLWLAILEPISHEQKYLDFATANGANCARVLRLPINFEDAEAGLYLVPRNQCKEVNNKFGALLKKADNMIQPNPDALPRAKENP